VQSGDQFYFTGNKHSGTAAHLTYTVDGDNTVKDMRDQLESVFGCTASIDAFGRLKLVDATGGDSAFAITDFLTFAYSEARPFSSAVFDTSYRWAISPGRALDAAGQPITNTAVLLTSIFDNDGEQMAANDVFTFTGNTVAGVATPGGTTFTIDAASTIQDLLTFIENAYGAGAGTISASLDTDGRIRVLDFTSDSNDLTIAMAMTASMNDSDPFGDGAAVATAFSSGSMTSSNIDITTSKRQLISRGRAFSTDMGMPPVITAATAWSSVYGPNGWYSMQANDTITFTGTLRDGSSFHLTYIVPSGTTLVQDLLDLVSIQLGVVAAIDSAGRLVMTAWQSGPSLLAVTSISYARPPGGAGTGPEIFGLDGSSFDYIEADSSEDGSQAGALVSTDFIGEGIAGAW